MAISLDAHAFEIATHARISHAAVLQSEIATSDALSSLGFPGGTSTDLGRHYVDLPSSYSSAARVRSATRFESSNNRMEGVPEQEVQLPPEVTAWIMRGAIREDDGGLFLGFTNPHDDPFGRLNRFCNHFYDPVTNTKLSTNYCTGDDRTSAPLWASGTKGLSSPLGGIAKPAPLSERDRSRRNHYTWLDAREAMWRALTLREFKDEDGTLRREDDGVLRTLPPPVQPMLISPFSSIPVTAQNQHRTAYWATTFFSLGTVLHLNQDMAQPQHTRLELHPLALRKEFENYLEARTLAEFNPTYKSSYSGMKQAFTLTKLSFAPTDGQIIPVPAFGNLSDFWSTATGDSVDTGLGLGDYSNTRFFSIAHNLGNDYYRLPFKDLALYQPVSTADVYGLKQWYLDGAVRDPLDHSSTNIHLTRPALLRGYLGDLGREALLDTIYDGKKIAYTLDARVFDDYAKLLIPRAVAYSAGIIDYFFRGTMQISLPDEGLYALVDHAKEASAATGGFRDIKLKVANTTPGDQMNGGVLVAVVKFHRNRCYRADLSNGPTSVSEALQCRSPDEEIVVSKPILVGGLDRAPKQFKFEFPSIVPINATDLFLQVVFRGQLGNEPDAVVVATKDLYEPTFFAYQNDTDYISIGNNIYTAAYIESFAPLKAMLYPTCDYWPSVPSCMYDDDLSLVLEIGTRPASIHITRLPVRQYVRFAYLADSATTRFRRQLSSCTNGTSSLEVKNVKWQSDYVDYASRSTVTTYSRPFSIRGVFSSHQTSCFWFGDSIGPSNDDWQNSMPPITGTGPTPLSSLNF